MGTASKRGRSWVGPAVGFLLGATACVLVANCSSSTTTGVRRPHDEDAGECNPGITRQCVGPGACKGGQKCGQDSLWGDCDCGTAMTGVGGTVGTGGSVGQSGAGGVIPSSGGAGNGGSTFGSGGAGTGGQTGSGGACAAIDVRRGGLPVDMYIMFDQSQSMATQVVGESPPITWWTAAQRALSRFVQDPTATGLGVGIQFFPYKGSIEGPDPTVPGSSCFAGNYATPEVEIGILPGNTSALQAAIQNHAPTTFTPTAAALQGAIQHMQQWGPAHPGRQPVVVLVTDGFPTECDPQDPSLIAQIAKAAYEGVPRVATFVVGFQTGEALDNLGQIAQAGGTGQAYLIKDGDIGAQFVQAMLAVSTTPLDCAFDIPKTTSTGQPVDLAQVWVQYVSAATGIPQTIPRLDNLGQCASAADGWYLDAPPPASQKVMICPQTCKKYAAGSIHIMYGCLQVATP